MRLWFIPLLIACMISLSFFTVKGQEQLYHANIRIRGIVNNIQNNVTIRSFSTSHTFTAITSVTIKEILQKPETFDQTDSVKVSYDYSNPPNIETGDVVEVYGFWFPALDTPWSRTIRVDDQVSGSYLVNIADLGPVYDGIAQYYDNRKAAVTISFDDWTGSGEKYEAGLAMLTRKRLYHTAGIITRAKNMNWTGIQRWLDKAYMEIGSHSRTHQHIPYNDYDSEVAGSKTDIIGNLTLPALSSFQGNEYVYTWIEPYGQSDSNVRKKLGAHGYLADRTISSDASEWSTWDDDNNLFNRIGFTVEMGNPPSWQGTHDAAKLNAKFDHTYNTSGIYHLTFHPNWVDWTPNAYADNHTAYISNRPDIWYVSFGNLYLYHWTATRNMVQVSFDGSGENTVFKISAPLATRQTFGTRYPITYIFNISSSWTTGHAYYRYKETDPWTSLPTKNSKDLFNGINASRFDFTNHKAYTSIGFAETGNNIYLRLQSAPLETIPPITEAGHEPTIIDTSKNSDIDTLTLIVAPALIKPLPPETIEITIGTALSAGIIARTITLKKRKKCHKAHHKQSDDSQSLKSQPNNPLEHTRINNPTT